MFHQSLVGSLYQSLLSFLTEIYEGPNGHLIDQTAYDTLRDCDPRSMRSISVVKKFQGRLYRVHLAWNGELQITSHQVPRLVMRSDRCAVSSPAKAGVSLTLNTTPCELAYGIHDRRGKQGPYVTVTNGHVYCGQYVNNQRTGSCIVIGRCTAMVGYWSGDRFFPDEHSVKRFPLTPQPIWSGLSNAIIDMVKSQVPLDELGYLSDEPDEIDPFTPDEI